MKTYALKLAYLPNLSLGGFVIQPNKETILSLLINSLIKARILENRPVVSLMKKIKYASRTDKGVGALSQVITVESLKEPILDEINHYLPSDIRVLDYCHVNSSFDPRRDAIWKIYSYFSPITPNFSINNAVESARVLKGIHDFSNFSKRDRKRQRNNVVLIKEIKLTKIDNKILFIQLQANSFLWQMCRRIVTHLLDIGYNRVPIDSTLSLLNPRVQMKKPAAAPPNRLVLERIIYNEPLFIRERKSRLVESFKRKIAEHIISINTDLSFYEYFLLKL